MKLALRKNLPPDSSLSQKIFSRLIKARLVSKYFHGGIIIEDVLYHSTFSEGPHCLLTECLSQDEWDLFELGGDDSRAIAEFLAACNPPENWWSRFWWKVTKGYDTFSLLAFIGPAVRVSWLHYCFELCSRMYTGQKPNERITPEILLTYIKHHVTKI